MKLSMSRLGSYGRFGNQLFQIASVMGMAAKYKAEAVFPAWEYEKYFVKPIPHGEQVKQQVKEGSFNAYDWQLTEDTDILGYLQSEKNFAWIEDKIREQFTFKPEVIQSVKDKFSDLFSCSVETILIQIRRTDYVGSAAYYQLSVIYFIQALVEHFPNWQQKNLVFISDDIAYCKVHFECLPNTYFADIPDYEQMALATLCDHFIIANSSFGWWGAWLGEKPHSKIIHSGRLHAGKFLEQTNEEDYYPARWTNFKKEDYKINLLDCTFTIPVFFDHKDRKQNLDLSVCMLQQSFDTNIIVGEQGGNTFQYMATWCRYINFSDSEKSFMQHFHRTKMLNDMAMAANTHYIANWDADVIIPPLQIYLSVMKLRNGNTDMIFPYDGRFARLPREPWFKIIEKHLDIGIIGDTEPKGKRGKPVPESSVGGAVFFNKESFIDGGMENEYMISFGPEDGERNDRFTMLGFKVSRVCELGTGLGGCLYHIDHWCGDNSSKKNPFFRANHEEKDKIHMMTPGDLRLYVDTWPWRHKYTEAYFHRISEGSIRSAKEVYKALEEIGIKFNSIVDVGCGVGEWDYEGKYYIGIDHKIPKKSLIIQEEKYVELDLERINLTEISIGSILKGLKNAGDKFDLCLCLEVAEHISEARADALIEMLCSLSDTVLFSAAIPFQGGTGHVNEQWQSWWGEKFYNNNFVPHFLQPDIKNNPQIELWYRQNIVLYTRFNKEHTYNSDFLPEGKLNLVEDFVLPAYYEEIIKNLKNQING